jgi:hypothetical protein
LPEVLDGSALTCPEAAGAVDEECSERQTATPPTSSTPRAMIRPKIRAIAQG